MNHEERDQQYFAIIRSILADAVARGVLSDDGQATRCNYKAMLPGSIPAEVALSSFIPPRPAGDLPPEAYLKFRLWADEPRPHARGYFNVAFRADRGWMLYGDFDYHSVRTRAADLERLVEAERHRR